MTTTYTIADQHTDARAENVTGDDVAEIVGDWFVDTEMGEESDAHQVRAELSGAIHELGERLGRDGRDDWAKVQGLAEYLGLSIERHNG